MSGNFTNNSSEASSNVLSNSSEADIVAISASSNVPPNSSEDIVAISASSNVPSNSSEADIVAISGPSNASLNWWNNEAQKRVAIASLVDATYTLEKDRRDSNHSKGVWCRLCISSSGSKSTDLSPAPSFEKFGFKLNYPLVDAKSRIFGAVFENEHPPPIYDTPFHVIAFRGTLFTKKDFQHNLRVVLNCLECCKRSKMSIQKVEDIVLTKKSTVWLAGHSLGASRVMLVGRYMVKKHDVFLESFLFNPPFLVMDMLQVKDTRLKRRFRTFKIRMTAHLVKLANEIHENNQTVSSSNFVSLKDWVPYLFVNAGDFVCAEYIRYFEQRKYMENKGLGDIARLAAHHSPRSAFISLFIKHYHESHLIPSANLIVNSEYSRNILKNHSLSQWWKSDLELDSTPYTLL